MYRLRSPVRRLGQVPENPQTNRRRRRSTPWRPHFRRRTSAKTPAKSRNLHWTGKSPDPEEAHYRKRLKTPQSGTFSLNWLYRHRSLQKSIKLLRPVIRRRFGKHPDNRFVPRVCIFVYILILRRFKAASIAPSNVLLMQKFFEA